MQMLDGVAHHYLRCGKKSQHVEIIYFEFFFHKSIQADDVVPSHPLYFHGVSAIVEDGPAPGIRPLPLVIFLAGEPARYQLQELGPVQGQQLHVSTLRVAGETAAPGHNDW